MNRADRRSLTADARLVYEKRIADLEARAETAEKDAARLDWVLAEWLKLGQITSIEATRAVIDNEMDIDAALAQGKP
jgi:hypothetical protein